MAEKGSADDGRVRLKECIEEGMLEAAEVRGPPVKMRRQVNEHKSKQNSLERDQSKLPKGGRMPSMSDALDAFAPSSLSTSVMSKSMPSLERPFLTDQPLLSEQEPSSNVPPTIGVSASAPSIKVGRSSPPRGQGKKVQESNVSVRKPTGGKDARAVSVDKKDSKLRPKPSPGAVPTVEGGGGRKSSPRSPPCPPVPSPSLDEPDVGSSHQAIAHLETPAMAAPERVGGDASKASNSHNDANGQMDSDGDRNVPIHRHTDSHRVHGPDAAEAVCVVGEQQVARGSDGEEKVGAIVESDGVGAGGDNGQRTEDEMAPPSLHIQNSAATNAGFETEGKSEYSDYYGVVMHTMTSVTVHFQDVVGTLTAMRLTWSLQSRPIRCLLLKLMEKALHKFNRQISRTTKALTKLRLSPSLFKIQHQYW